jgi:hypothetical protein
MSGSENARRARLIALSAAALNVVGMSFDSIFWRTRLGVVQVWHLISIGFSAGLVVILTWYRQHPPAWLSAVAFLLNNAVIATALGVGNATLAATLRPWTPFQAEKLGALAVAVLAPPSVIAGVVSIAIFGGSAVLSLALFDAATRAQLTGEPWATLGYTIFGFGLYFYRVRSRQAADKMADAIAEANSHKRVSRALLAFRDFANTPLQTLRLTNAVLGARHPDARRLVERMGRAIARLAEFNEIMSRYEPEGHRDEQMSFDPTAILERRTVQPPQKSR